MECVSPFGPSAPQRTRSRPVKRRRRWRQRRSRTRTVERLSLLRRAHDCHRDLRARLPAAAVAYPINRARQFMTITPLSPSPNTAPVRPCYLTGTTTRCRQRPSLPPSAGKTLSIEYQISVAIASRAAKTGVQLVTQPSLLLGPAWLFEGFAPDLQQMILGLVMDGAAWPVCTEMWPGGVVNLAARGMLVMSVARRLRSEDPLPAYCAAPL